MNGLELLLAAVLTGRSAGSEAGPTGAGPTEAGDGGFGQLLAALIGTEPEGEEAAALACGLAVERADGADRACGADGQSGREDVARGRSGGLAGSGMDEDRADAAVDTQWVAPKLPGTAGNGPARDLEDEPGGSMEAAGLAVLPVQAWTWAEGLSGRQQAGLDAGADLGRREPAGADAPDALQDGADRGAGPSDRAGPGRAAAVDSGMRDAGLQAAATSTMNRELRTPDGEGMRLPASAAAETMAAMPMAGRRLEEPDALRMARKGGQSLADALGLDQPDLPVPGRAGLAMTATGWRAARNELGGAIPDRAAPLLDGGLNGDALEAGQARPGGMRGEADGGEGGGEGGGEDGGKAGGEDGGKGGGTGPGLAAGGAMAGGPVAATAVSAAGSGGRAGVLLPLGEAQSGVLTAPASAPAPAPAPAPGAVAGGVAVQVEGVAGALRVRLDAAAAKAVRLVRAGPELASALADRGFRLERLEVAGRVPSDAPDALLPVPAVAVLEGRELVAAMGSTRDAAARAGDGSGEGTGAESGFGGAFGRGGSEMREDARQGRSLLPQAGMARAAGSGAADGAVDGAVNGRRQAGRLA